jgi:hypothetical protein
MLPAVKGWVLAMLARQLADCAWLRSPAVAAFDLRCARWPAGGRSAPRNIGLADLSKEQHKVAWRART